MPQNNAMETDNFYSHKDDAINNYVLGLLDMINFS